MAEFTASTAFLVGDDHTSEPRLLRCASGILLVFYRLDPGLQGSHVGDDGHILVRRSTDNGATWSDAITVYSDQYDDRNHGVFQVPSGRVYCFFRRLSVADKTTIDHRHVYSDDDGLTWSDLQAPTFPVTPSPAESHYVPTRGILLPTYGENLYFTEDGSHFDRASELVCPETIPSLRLTENAQAYLGNGIMYSVWRHEVRTLRRFYGAFSEDFGRTWKAPAKLRVLRHWGSAPILHVAGDKLYLIAGDRRRPARKNLRNRLWLSSLSVADYARPRRWKIEGSLARPEPSLYRFYGYPSAVHLDGDTWLVAFTECYLRESGEGANIYTTTVDMGPEFRPRSSGPRAL